MPSRTSNRTTASTTSGTRFVTSADGTAIAYDVTGAALVLEALPTGVPMGMVALYEVPFIVDGSHAPRGADLGARTQRLVDAGRRGEAVTLFLRTVGVPAIGVGDDAPGAGLERAGQPPASAAPVAPGEAPRGPRLPAASAAAGPEAVLAPLLPARPVRPVLPVVRLRLVATSPHHRGDGPHHQQQDEERQENPERDCPEHGDHPFRPAAPVSRG